MNEHLITGMAIPPEQALARLEHLRANVPVFIEALEQKSAASFEKTGLYRSRSDCAAIGMGAMLDVMLNAIGLLIDGNDHFFIDLMGEIAQDAANHLTDDLLKVVAQSMGVNPEDLQA